MKKLVLILSTLCILLLSTTVRAGSPLQSMAPGIATPNPASQPNSHAYGRSLDAWVESYLRNLYEDADVPAGNVAFLPIIGESPFDIQVRPGTALVLPIALYLGFPTDTPLGPDKFTAAVTLDGAAIAEPKDEYYVGPTYVDPLILGLVAFYEGLVVVINPLTPGEHTIVLYSSIDAPEGLYEFNNTWNITVAP